MPAGGAARSLQSHRYGSFEENGDDDSDEEDVGRAFEMVQTPSKRALRPSSRGRLMRHCLFALPLHQRCRMSVLLKRFRAACMIGNPETGGFPAARR